jgi:hypothetical protein
MTPILILAALICVSVLWLVRRAVLAQVAAGLALAAVLAVLAVWLFAPGFLVPKPSPSTGRAVGWELSFHRGTKFDSSAVELTTIVPMEVDHPACANSSDWIGEPAIAYTPWSVTITMSSREPFTTATCSGGLYLSGQYTEVELREPLGGRQLFDGSKKPPHARSPGDPFSSVSR